MSDLKPCPFCGGEAKSDLNMIYPRYEVFCLSCFASMPADVTGNDVDELKAITAWNKRVETGESNEIATELSHPLQWPTPPEIDDAYVNNKDGAESARSWRAGIDWLRTRLSPAHSGKSSKNTITITVPGDYIISTDEIGMINKIQRIR